MHATSIRRNPRQDAYRDYAESVKDRRDRENRESLLRMARYIGIPVMIALFLIAIAHALGVVAT